MPSETTNQPTTPTPATNAAATPANVSASAQPGVAAVPAQAGATAGDVPKRTPPRGVKVFDRKVKVGDQMVAEQAGVAS